MCLLLTGAIVAGQGFANYPFVIDRFEADILVRPDSRLVVTETISTTFQSPRRGIIRVIPEVFDTGHGTTRRTLIDQIRVVDETGRPVTTQVTREEFMVRIRMGDEALTFPAGTQKRYRIQYRVANAVNWFGQRQDWHPHAEVYWNVTGNGWDTVIRQTDVAVRFPEVSDGGDVRARMFFGRSGARDGLDLSAPGAIASAESSMDLAEANLTIRHNAPLRPGEGLTIALALPTTVLPEVGYLQRAYFFVDSNPILLVPFGVFAAMFFVWLGFGRDLKGRYVEVQFEPPHGMSATECGFLIDGKVDPQDVSAAIVTLATSGYLFMHTDNTHGRFTPTSITLDVPLADPVRAKPLGEFERSMLTALRSVSGPIRMVDLRANVAPEVPRWAGALARSMKRHGFYRFLPIESQTAAATWGILVVLGLIYLLSGQVRNTNPEILLVICAVISVAIVLGFAYLMPRRTKRGADALAQLKGFERAMRGREHFHRWFTETNMDLAKYEEYLPFAIMFGSVAEWNEICGPVLTENPSWLVTEYRDPTTGFEFFPDDTEESFFALGTAATTMPRTAASSGSSAWGGGGGGGWFGGGSSGGSSGGGFGGGGGSSW